MLHLSKIKVCSRDSNLAKAQVQEIYELISSHYPEIVYETTYLKSCGDLDLLTSLRDMSKTDFFTKKIDEKVLDGSCDMAVHSAKDLPEKLPPGLTIAYITDGIDPRDALVIKPQALPKIDPLVATSSVSRELAVKKLYPQAKFCDLRGTIEQRLAKLNDEKIDAVVVAEAAIIRLKLTSLTRVYLSGATTEGQGKLAVVVKNHHLELLDLFASISTALK